MHNVADVLRFESNTEIFQREARRSLRDDLPYEAMCSNMCMGLAGEIGEVIDIMKKHIYQGKELDITDVIEEVGDVLWYIANFCNVNNITMDECMESNIKKLRERFPNGFTIKDANERKDKMGE
ncbi:MAG: nucleoside triphosphate pyrophosphohydrolase family protein [Peptostreptococcaceae bacterium]|nr:nucleoside triphosphate pyrophosphohydrolase family protein [Peptostreptococcaceae bacterium]